MSKVVCDKSLCSGCLACVVACMDQHYDETEVDAVSPRIYEKRTSERTGLVNYITRSCQHCADAPCMKACPLDVFKRTENGYVVSVHQRRCIGCKKCEKTCPNGAITVDNFCAHIDYSKCTNCGACKEACPRHIIQ